MGGWLALLLARELERAGELGRLAGMVLIAPAVDFTEALLWDRAPEDARRAIMEEGCWKRPSAYSAEPYVYTRTLIEDGRKHLLLGGIVRSHCPVRILQGMRDEDVPFRHAPDPDRAHGRRKRDVDARSRRRASALTPGGSRAAVPGDRGVGLTAQPDTAPNRCKPAPWVLSHASARSVSGNSRRVSFQYSGE